MTAVSYQSTETRDFDALKESTADDREAVNLSAAEVIERVTEILGYDLFEDALMAEGYAEFSDEMLAFSESTLHAQNESLPPQE